MPIHLRPREKAMLQGLGKLSDIELLSLFIRNGTGQNNALSIAAKIFEQYYDFATLKNTSITEIKNFKGIGVVKGLEILALFEVYNRIEKGNVKHLVINNCEDAAKFAFPHLGRNPYEVFFVIYLNKYNEVLFYQSIYKGTEYSVDIDPKEIFIIGLKVSAKKFYCFHNHPSGEISPSKADVVITQRIKRYSQILNVEFIAHIIINKWKKYFVI